MDKPSTEVVRFAPQQRPRAELEPIDQAGHAVIGLLKEAADISKASIERAMTVAHRLSLELRTAEDRIRELEGEIERLESRATRAEQWLGTIKKEIEDTLIAPMEASRSKQQVLN
jgi:TolA-binding protein